MRKLLTAYEKSKNFFRPALYNFSNKDIVDFFEKRGVKTKVERGGRAFPVSDRAKDVLLCLERYLKSGDVEIKLNTSVRKIVAKTNAENNDDGTKKIEHLLLKNGKKIFADNFVIATGGKSYPKTGSKGDGYRWIEQLEHTLVEPKPALTPIVVKEKWVKKLEGLSLKNVEVSLWSKQNKKLASFFGEALFTASGLSGPTVLNLSKKISENDEKELKIRIDFKPALEYPTLDKRIQRDFLEYKNKQFSNSLEKLLPKKLIPTIIWRSEIEPDKKVNEISKTERKKIVALLKSFELEVRDLVWF